MIEKMPVPVPGTECPSFGPGSKDWTIIDLIKKVNELIDRENERTDPFAPPKQPEEPTSA